MATYGSSTWLYTVVTLIVKFLFQHTFTSPSKIRVHFNLSHYSSRRGRYIGRKPICSLLPVPQVRNMFFHSPYLRHGGGKGRQLFCQHSVPDGTKKCDKLKCTLLLWGAFQIVAKAKSLRDLAMAITTSLM
jgi:hypothetical protein